MKIDECEIGLRVMVVKALDGNADTIDEIGVIRHTRPGRNWVGVEFERRIEGGHDLEGQVKHGYGYYGHPDCIVPYTEHIVPQSCGISISDIIG